MSSVEILAIIASLAGVILSMGRKSLAWLCNILASGLYGYIFWQSGLYSDMELQGFFILMAAYGWWNWSQSEADWKPEKSPYLPLFIGLMVALLFGAGSGYLHTLYFPSVSFPYLDATRCNSNRLKHLRNLASHKTQDRELDCLDYRRFRLCGNVSFQRIVGDCCSVWRLYSFGHQRLRRLA
ncbi:MAG: hypothetical protein RLZZ197_1297 [Bacteroidota bacterium]